MPEYMETRRIDVRMSPDAARLYDELRDDRDILLVVEKAIVKALYPERVIPAGLGAEDVDTDPDLIAVEPGPECPSLTR